jgi:hypothetical protein
MDVPSLLYRVMAAYTTPWGLAVSVGMYVWFAFCLVAIARKTKVAVWWVAPLPVLNFYVMCAAGKREGRCFLGFLAPFAALVAGALAWIPALIIAALVVWAVVWISVWMDVCKNTGRASWLGLLIVLPVLNLVLLGTLAFGD